MRIHALTAVSAVLAGCATTPVPTADAKLTSAVIDAALTRVRADTGQVIIKRDLGAMGSVCLIRTTVNGKPLADLATGEMVVAHLPAGEHVLGATTRSALCGGGDAETTAVVRAGETTTFRVGLDQGASIKIGRTAQ